MVFTATAKQLILPWRLFGRERLTILKIARRLALPAAVLLGLMTVWAGYGAAGDAMMASPDQPTYQRNFVEKNTALVASVLAATYDMNNPPYGVFYRGNVLMTSAGVIAFSRTMTDVVTLPFPVTTQTNPDLAQGLRQMVQLGKNGTAVLYESQMTIGGKVVGTHVLNETVKSPPVPEIVAVGTGELSRGGFTGRYVTKIRVEATAYWADPRWSNGYTFTGVKVHIGSIAVDPSVIPLGTRLYVDGYGYGVADDTGSAIKGNHIDLYFPTNAECQAWGLRYVWVYILAP